MSSTRTDKETTLQQLAASNTFDTDWPTLKGYFQESLNDAFKIFLTKGPPRPYCPRGASPLPLGASSKPQTSLPSITTDEVGKPPAESLLLSPSHPASTIGPASELAHNPEDLRPSTVGGLVIPPFPPLDPSRRRTPSPAPMQRSPSPLSPRSNGIHSQRVVAMGIGVPDEEWDEETVIGGKKLQGWLDETQGKAEIQRLNNLLDGMEAPPFTIQRLAELLLHPTSQHATFGKFSRAIEKSLLVTSPWGAPSYVYIPPSNFAAYPGVGPISSASSPSSDGGSESDSTVPAGSTTPLFSPIPFLVHPSHEPALAVDTGHPAASNRTEEGLLSPLNLSEEKTPSSSGRSPTPEPEDSIAMTSGPSINDIDIDTEMVSPGDIPRPENPQGTSDPANTSYLGRVDELDTGPLPTSEQVGIKRRSSTSSSSSQMEVDSRETVVMAGQGEGGHLAPHGMADKPMPLSTTTVVKDEPEGGRMIKGLRRNESEKSLGERFVSGGVQKPEEAGLVDSAEGLSKSADEEEGGE
ncbi:hypothetical protein J010_01309 [Cryptococcus neoformans]|nr:hypothetical protein C355_01436 [Cryptococcus neoformans var. grubii Th84]OXH16396.1 hypothetical protein J010_01309 [Cryptococcus neoformans var. grubii]OXH36412.1 hypothetical protein J009_01321 [Cryptococcus neoformans var. grubii]OXH57326.1 hypothetical protein J003_01327 [Cryptococcus neoformans var. grubii]OXH57677.1 hypothetical protein J004_01363 [Cryptococcus neoformans var. grubii]